MATVEKTILSPSAASGITDEAFNTLDAKLPFSRVLPVTSNNGEKTVRWTPYIPAPAIDAMLLRAWDAEAGYLKTTEQSAEKYAGLLPMSKKAHISERDLVGRTGDNTFLRSKLSEQFDQLGREAAVKVELLRIAAMVDAKISIKENGVNATYDFERPAALHDVAPTKKWNAAGATPVEGHQVGQADGRQPRPYPIRCAHDKRGHRGVDHERGDHHRVHRSEHGKQPVVHLPGQCPSGACILCGPD